MSLEKLKLSYVDLYLVHMPFSFHLNETNLTPAVNEDGTFSLDTESDVIETWKVIISLFNKLNVNFLLRRRWSSKLKTD